MRNGKIMALGHNDVNLTIDITINVLQQNALKSIQCAQNRFIRNDHENGISYISITMRRNRINLSIKNLAE